jgi:membrane protein
VAGWFGDEHVPRKSAALAFYTGFSLAPMVLLIVLLFGLIVDTALLREQLVAQASALFGGESGELIGGILERADHPDAGFSAVFAIVGLVVGATTTFAELKDGLDDVLAQKAPETTGLWSTIRARILSFGVFVSIGFLLLVSLAANAALAVLSNTLAGWLHWEAVLLGRILTAVIAFLGTFLLFLGIFRFLPERRLGRKPLLIAAVASTVLFSVGRIAIGLYLGNTDTIGAFGAAGSLAVILIWVYYSSLAFYTGALIGRLAEEGIVTPGAPRTEGG